MGLVDSASNSRRGKKQASRAALFWIPAVILLAILAFSLTRALQILIPQWQEQRAFDELKHGALDAAGLSVPSATLAETPSERLGDDTVPPPDGSEETARTAAAPGTSPYALLAQSNQDFAGWISIADTKIDYPVMKSAEDDPQYYLHRDFYGNDSYSGCLFIGGGCDADSDSFIIYGHNMQNGNMFGTLENYADHEYADSHSEIYFSTPDGERTYRVFAAFQTEVYADLDGVFKYYEAIGSLSQEEYERTVSSVRGMSLARLSDAPTYPQQLLFLSTCSYHTENGRFVVAAYRSQ